MNTTLIGVVLSGGPGEEVTSFAWRAAIGGLQSIGLEGLEAFDFLGKSMCLVLYGEQYG